MKYTRTILTLILVLISSITYSQDRRQEHDAFMSVAMQKNAAANYQPITQKEWGYYSLGVHFIKDLGNDFLSGVKELIIPKDAIFSDSLYHAALEGDSAATHKLAYCYAFGRGVDKNETRAKTLYTRLAERGQATWKALMDFYLCTGIFITNDSLKNKAIEEKYAPYVSLFDGEQAANMGYCESLYPKAFSHCQCGICRGIKTYEILDNIDLNLMSKISVYPRAAYACAAYYHYKDHNNEKAYQYLSGYLGREIYEKFFISLEETHKFKLCNDMHVNQNVVRDAKNYGMRNDPKSYSEYEKVVDEAVCDLFRFNFNMNFLDCPNGKLYKNKELLERAEVAFSSKDFDADEAFAYIKKKHEEGNRMATFILGSYYYNGKFVEEDINKAKDLILQSANAGLVPAIYWYGWIIDKYYPGNEKVALDTYAKAIKLGYTGAQRDYDVLAEKIAENERENAGRSRFQAIRSAFAQKYGAAIQQGLDKGQLKVGTPLTAFTEYVGTTGVKEYSYSLSIDHGSSKCYDIYRKEMGFSKKIGYVWVSNGKVTSVAY